MGLRHFRVKAVRQGIKMAHVGAGNKPKSWRPLTWEMVKGLEGCTVDWGVGRRVVWMNLALSYLLPLPTSELFAGYVGQSSRGIVLKGGEILHSSEGITRCIT